MAKSDNMLAILWMLNSEIKITAKQIADKLEINVRTVYRYINSLCASGVPIVSDTGQNGGYSLLNNFTRAPLFFDIEEQKALFHAAVFAKEAGYPYSETLDKATQKLKMYSNQAQGSILNRHLAGFEVINSNIPLSVKSTLEELERAIANEYSIEIEYHTSHTEQPCAADADRRVHRRGTASRTSDPVSKCAAAASQADDGIVRRPRAAAHSDQPRCRGRDREASCHRHGGRVGHLDSLHPAGAPRRVSCHGQGQSASA
jgi:biotin operon repressor